MTDVERGKVAVDFIRSTVTTRGFPPTIRELADHLDIAPPTALAVLRELEADGQITRQPGVPRSIRITGDSG